MFVHNRYHGIQGCKSVPF